jgi:hypothetical protein
MNRLLIACLQFCVMPLGVLGSVSGLVVQAQVVQLPAYRTFGYTGSAWVPDQGTAPLAGGYTSSSSLTGSGWGPYAGRAGGAVTGATSLSASAQIIDLRALDEAILEANVPRSARSSGPVSANSPAAGGGRRFLSTTEAYLGDTGVIARDYNEYRRVLAGHSPQPAAPASRSQAEADIRYYLEAGKKAEMDNHIIAARVYYRLAMEAMPPDMIERYHQILEERKQADQQMQEADSGNRARF